MKPAHIEKWYAIGRHTDSRQPPEQLFLPPLVTIRIGFLWRRLVTIHPSVAVEFLYARFAYTVIKLFRLNVFFDSVEDNEEVKIAEQKLLEKLEKQAHGGLNGSEASELEHSQASDGDEESDMGMYRCFCQ